MGRWPQFPSVRTRYVRYDKLMKIQVSGKQTDLSESLRQHVERRLRAGVEKYFGDGIEASVVFSREARHHRADCAVHIGHGIQVQSHAETDDITTCFDTAADRLEKQLRRYKRRLRNHHSRQRKKPDDGQEAQTYVLAPESEEADEPETFQPVTVAESTTRIHTLTVGEAVMRMDLADLPVMMFRNSGNGRLNVVYRRNDGHIGWIDPSDPENN